MLCGLLLAPACRCDHASPPPASTRRSGDSAPSSEASAPPRDAGSTPAPNSAGVPLWYVSTPAPPWTSDAAPPCLEGFSQVAFGSPSCAVCRSGRVYCWGEPGQPDDGRLGRPTPGNRASVAIVDDVADAVQAATGGAFACAVLRSGVIRCWGEGLRGQLGSGRQFPHWICETLPSGAPRCGMRDDSYAPLREPRPGEREEHGPVTVKGIDDAVEVSAGLSHACARSRSGKVACWGDNTSGQLGVGSSPTRSLEPVEIEGIHDAVRVLAAGDTTYVLRAGGEVLAWGDNRLGSLGDGTNDSHQRPQSITGLTDVVALGSNGGTTCALRRNGEAWCWGFGFGKALVTRPARLRALDGAREVLVDHDHVCGRMSGGELRCSEIDSPVARVCYGPRYPRDRAISVPDLGQVESADIGGCAGCAIAHGGVLLCWGDNQSKQVRVNGP
jgi:hypothetical protein